MSKFIVLDGAFEALVAGGIITDDPSYIRRVVIDLQAGSPGRVYIEKFADKALLDVIAEGGIHVVGTGEDEA